MAKVIGSVKGDWEFNGKEDLSKYFRRTEKALADLLKAGDKVDLGGNLTGVVIQIPWADGYAFYRVASDKPRCLELEHIPVGDAWQLPAYMIRGLGRRDIVGMVERGRYMKKLFSKKS